MPSDVPGVLSAVAAVLLAVILDRDFDVLPTHVEIADQVTELVMNPNLRLRPGKSGVD